MGQLASRPQVVKFHGDFNHPPQMVVTESDYEKRLAFQTEMDFRLRSDVLGRAVLFLGYSFRDANVAYLFRLVNEYFHGLPANPSGRRAYIVIADPSDFEIRLFRARNIEVIGVNGGRIIEDITSVLDAVQTWHDSASQANHVQSRQTSTNTRRSNYSVPKPSSQMVCQFILSSTSTFARFRLPNASKSTSKSWYGMKSSGVQSLEGPMYCRTRRPDLRWVRGRLVSWRINQADVERTRTRLRRRHTLNIKAQQQRLSSRTAMGWPCEPSSARHTAAWLVRRRVRDRSTGIRSLFPTIPSALVPS